MVSFLLISGCGGGGNSGFAFPPPFNTAKGEGRLVSHNMVVSYPTATSGNQPGLDAMYVNMICAGLSANQCATNKANLNTPLFGNFNVDADPIGKNPLGIKLVDANRITYTAINVDQSALTVSGGILVPEIAPASLKGIVLYYHGTTVQRSAVPSNFVTAANPNGDSQGALFAAIWASQGYVVIMPDYIGLGVDKTHAHPYVVYPRENAQSGLAMAKAAGPFLASSYGISGTVPLFIAGYSEGGAYALEAEHLMQNNPLYALQLKVTLRKAVPLSGVFDLTGTMLPYLFDNVTAAHNNWFSLSPTQSGLSKPFLGANLALSFSDYSGVPPTSILMSEFYNCATSSACAGSANLSDLYYKSTLVNGTTPGADTIVAIIAYNQATKLNYSSDNNPITPLLTPAYATALMNHDMANPLFKQIDSANTYLFVPSVPVTLVSLMEDSIVTRKNTDVAFNYFEKQNPSGPYKEELVNNTDFNVQGLFSVGPVDHTTEVPFISVLLLNEFNIS